MARQLDTESLLLLYACGELPSAECAELEARLASDSALAARYQEISGSLASFESGMRRLDVRPPGNQEAVVRRVGAAMRQHVADRLAAESRPAVQAPMLRRYPRWVYAAASVAAVVVIALSWWGRQPAAPLKISGSDPTNPRPIILPHNASPPQFADASMTPPEPDEFPITSNPDQQKAVASLEDSQRQLESLNQLSRGEPLLEMSDGHD